MGMGALDILAACLAVVASGLLAVNFLRQDRRGLPPGPKPHILTGNRLPATYPWRHYEKLAKEYGPIFTIWQGRKPLVVIGSCEAADALLEKRAAATADRPRSVVAGEVFSRGSRILFVGYGERWKRMRKTVHAWTQPSAAKKLETTQEKLAANFLSDILEQSSAHQHHAKVFSASLVLDLCYGLTKRTTYDDPFIAGIVRNSPNFAASLGPDWWADTMPWLARLPFTLRGPRKWSLQERDLWKRYYDSVRAKLAAGTQEQCFTAYLIEHEAELGLSPQDLWYLAGVLYQAGSDTTAATVSVAVMAAAKFPEKQKAAQAEIDRVVGRNRMPSFDDMPELPYLTAFANEVFRWRPISSGIAHATTEELQYKGYRIPKGTAIIGNHWGIHRDPVAFPDPDAFQPERWLEEGPEGLRLRTDIHHHGYGFGRRICSGLHIANRSVFIAVARLLWSFDIREKSAQPIDTMAFSNTFNSYPLHFEVDFIPRHDDVIKAIRSAEAPR